MNHSITENFLEHLHCWILRLIFLLIMMKIRKINSSKNSDTSLMGQFSPNVALFLLRYGEQTVIYLAQRFGA